MLGVKVGPFACCIDADFVRRFAAATSDRSQLAQAGEAVPLVAMATQIWEAQNAGRAALVPPEILASAAGGVHGEHDIRLHRPIVAGEPLRTWVEGHGCRPAGRNARVTLRYVTLDAADQVVAEQWWTTVFLATTCDPIGEPAPDHGVPDQARSRPVGTCEVEVDIDMAQRYAALSGDWSAHHFDVEAAQRSGADRPFLHGLCTMALCAQGVVQLVAEGEHERLRRVAVRFAAPMPIGGRLSLNVFDAGPMGYAFEGECDGRVDRVPRPRRALVAGGRGAHPRAGRTSSANSRIDSGVPKSWNWQTNSSAPASRSVRSTAATSSGVPATTPPQPPNRRCVCSTISSRSAEDAARPIGCCTDTRASPVAGRSSAEAIDCGRGAVPPVRVPGHEWKGQPGARPPDVHRHAAVHRPGAADGASQRPVLAVVVDGFAASRAAA